jgi:hypothetical protein
VEVADEDDVDVGVEGRIERAPDAPQEAHPIEQDRVGQDPKAADLEKYGRVAKEGDLHGRRHGGIVGAVDPTMGQAM